MAEFKAFSPWSDETLRCLEIVESLAIWSAWFQEANGPERRAGLTFGAQALALFAEEADDSPDEYRNLVCIWMKPWQARFAIDAVRDAELIHAALEECSSHVEGCELFARAALRMYSEHEDGRFAVSALNVTAMVRLFACHEPSTQAASLESNGAGDITIAALNAFFGDRWAYGPVVALTRVEHVNLLAGWFAATPVTGLGRWIGHANLAGVRIGARAFQNLRIAAHEQHACASLAEHYLRQRTPMFAESTLASMLAMRLREGTAVALADHLCPLDQNRLAEHAVEGPLVHAFALHQARVSGSPSARVLQEWLEQGPERLVADVAASSCEINGAGLGEEIVALEVEGFFDGEFGNDSGTTRPILRASRRPS